MFTVIIFIIVLSVLVFVHELGHFLMAKRSGMDVEEFGFGFPPRLFGVKRGNTTYTLNAIPFGGFVKILGEDGDAHDNPKSFSNQSITARILVIVAGVFMNLALAVVLLAIVNAFGFRVSLDDTVATQQARDIKIQIVRVAPGSPAAKAGLQTLEEVVSMHATKGSATDTQLVLATSTQAVSDFVHVHAGQDIVVTLRDGATSHDVHITPRLNPPAGEGSLGIEMSMTGIIQYPWYKAIFEGGRYAGIIFLNTAYGYFSVIKNLIIHQNAGVELTGPVGIASITGQAARMGIIYLLQFMALISINLAVLNIIPFPALDGGRLLFIIIEKIKGKPLSRNIEGIVHTVGFVVLLVFMLYVTTKDILRLF